MQRAMGHSFGEDTNKSPLFSIQKTYSRTSLIRVYGCDSIVYGDLYVVRQSLSSLEHLVKNGAERFIEDARDNLHRVRMLSDFNYYEGPVDKGSGGTRVLRLCIPKLRSSSVPLSDGVCPPSFPSSPHLNQSYIIFLLVTPTAVITFTARVCTRRQVCHRTMTQDVV